MRRSFSAGHRAVMEDDVTDPFDKKQSFGGWKQYVKELDSNTLPTFLARLCAPDKQCTYPEEEVLCVFETAAQFHGRNIVPHISQIASAIIRLMSSDAGSSHSLGFSKVICTLSRYVIDPLGTTEEKSGIISSLCGPLSGCLMSTKESVSSGSALCVSALIQSNNWQFASNELINDICLKVSGSLEEVHCQTISHLGLVVALLKRNRLTLEPYGRSLIRSGLSILDVSTKASNSLMIISSIQMIHSIMNNLDFGIISSEISSIVQAMEQLQEDSMPEISTPAFQAAETAKKLCRQEECGYGRRISPLAKYGGRHSRKGSYSHSVMDDAEMRGSGPSGSLSDDVQSAHRFRDHDSQPSVGQYSVVPRSARARKRLWCNGTDKSHQVCSDDFRHTAIPDYHDSVGVIAQSSSVGLLKSARRSYVVTRIADPCPTCLTPQTTNRLCQVSRRGTFSEDVRMQSTPRDAHRLPASPAWRQTQHCSGQYTPGEVHKRNDRCDSVQHDDQCHQDSKSEALLKSVRRSSDVGTRIADPYPTNLTPQSTKQFSQVSRRGTLSEEDVRMQSTPRKQLQFYNSCSDPKRDAHRLPASPTLRQMRHCSGQRTHGEVEERNDQCDSCQRDNQCHRDSKSKALLKSARRSSDVGTRNADPCSTCLTPQTTNQFSQVSTQRMIRSMKRKRVHSTDYSAVRAQVNYREQSIRRNHNLFVCCLDDSKYTSLKEYADRNNKKLVETIQLPEDSNHTELSTDKQTSVTTSNELKVILRRSYQLIKRMNKAGLTLRGLFSSRNFVVDEYLQLKFSVPGELIRRLKDGDADEDEHAFVRMVKREVFQQTKLPTDLLSWLFLIDGCEASYDDLKLQNISMMDEHQSIYYFMSMYDTLCKIESWDNSAYRNVIKELEDTGKYSGWQTKVNETTGNFTLKDTVIYRKSKGLTYSNGIRGLLDMLRNSRQHSAKEYEEFFTRIICHHFQDLMADLQRAMYREGYRQLTLKYSMS